MYVNAAAAFERPPIAVPVTLMLFYFFIIFHLQTCVGFTGGVNENAAAFIQEYIIEYQDHLGGYLMTVNVDKIFTECAYWQHFYFD